MRPAYLPILSLLVTGCSVLQGGASSPDDLADEAVPEGGIPIPRRVDVPNPHVLADLGVPLQLMMGLKSTGDQITFRDGRTLDGYAFSSGLSQMADGKLGELFLDDGVWFFDRHRQLRKARLWADLRSKGLRQAPDCELALTFLLDTLGEPTWETKGEARWLGQTVRTVWLDTTRAESENGTPRCIVEYTDASWYRGGDGILWKSKRVEKEEPVEEGEVAEGEAAEAEAEGE
jgi:hypothetical protein